MRLPSQLPCSSAGWRQALWCGEWQHGSCSLRPFSSRSWALLSIGESTRPWQRWWDCSSWDLGLLPLYPLTVGFAIEAAGPQGAAASARFMLAIGLAIISMPALLGGLADEVGLRLAHLVVPALLAIALICLSMAKLLQRGAVNRIA